MNSNIVSSTLNMSLSYNQKKVWKDTHGNLDNFYNQVAIDFTKKITAEDLKYALESLVKKHQNLTSRLVKTNNKEIEFSSTDQITIDYIESTEISKSTEISAFLNKEYDPFTDTPVRFGILLQKGIVTRLFIRVFALWADVKSIFLLLNDLKSILANIEPSEQGIAYSDYSTWYNELISEPDEDALQFWKDYNPNIDQKIIPFLSNDSTLNGFNKIVVTTIEGDIYQELKKQCSKTNQSIEHRLFTQFLSYLSQFTKESITIGYNSHKRNYEELDNTFGPISKVLPLTIENLTTKPIDTAIQLTKEQIEKIVLWSDYYTIDLKQEKNSIIQTRFEYIDSTQVNQDKEFTINDFYSIQDPFRCKLSCVDYGDKISIELYQPNSLNNEQETNLIVDQLKHYFSKLNSKTISGFGMLDQAITALSNDTIVQLDNQKSVIEMFQDQAERNPEALALVTEEKKYSYRELQLLSNQLANYLTKEYDINQGDVVCVKMDTSEWFIISILAILKAGAFYVPIDNNYPQDRVDFILNDCNPKVLILDEEKKQDQIQTLVPTNPVIYESECGFEAKITSDSIAYCIYTSGSTGKPKGCLVTHKNLSNYIQWANRYYFKNENEGNWGLITSISFDLTVTSIFTSLTRGKKLWIGDKNKDINELLEQSFQCPEIDTLKLTPSHVSLLKELSIDTTTIRTIICGGEQLTNKQVQILKQLNSTISVYNEYGPTEATVGCVVKEIKDVNEKITIGKPIANTTIHIINEEGSPCGIGMIGELVIAGEGVSKGYYNRPELNEEKFIKIQETKTNAYKTGDLARWLPNGELEFIGRIDSQVKIRGHRIELDEIENHLLALENIDQAVVLIKNENTEPLIAAYFTASDTLNKLDIKASLTKQLPNYMMPEEFYQLDELPITINGKVDKIALANTSEEEMDSGVPYVAPNNKTEATLVKIWEEVLGKEQIGIHDDFFELGGHSLKAIKLINEYHKVLKVKLTLKELFQNTTLKSHADLISDTMISEYQEIQPLGKQDTYPVSDGQKRIWMLSQFEESSIAYNMPAYIEVEGVYSPEVFAKAVEYCIAKHEILRTVYEQDAKGELKQKVLLKGQYQSVFDFIDYTTETNGLEKVKTYVNEDSNRPFDLEKGPLLRTALFKLSKEKYVFYYNLHHIVGDSWSLKVLEKDMFDAYEAYSNGNEPSQQNLRIQYKDYASWKLNQMEQGILNPQKEYWLSLLNGELPKTNLLNYENRPKHKTYQGHILGAYLSEDLTNKLRDFCDINGGSLFMGLLTVWKILFYKYTGKEDLIVGTPVACRNHKDLENQIGFYLNTLALRNQIRGADSFLSFFDRIKNTTLTAFKNQDYPFDRLVEDLEVKQDISRNAVFDIMFTLQSVESEKGLQKISDKVSRDTFDYGNALSKFDLDISSHEFEDGISFLVNFNKEVYSKEFISDLIQNYIYVLEELVQNQGKSLSEIDFIPKQVQEDMLGITKKLTQSSNDKTVLELFKDQVAQKPEAIALVFEEKQLTYQELDKASDKLAIYLKNNYQIKTGDFVGVKLERSEWLIISILAVIKSGGAYLPISPSFPQERIDYIKKDSAYKVCIDATVLQKSQTASVLDNIESELGRSSQDDILYVIYTSGTTGNPKGVMVKDANLVSFIENLEDTFEFRKYQKLGATTNVTFDISILEILGGLCTGKELHLFSDEILQDPTQIMSEIKNRAIEIAQFTPSRLTQLYTTGQEFSESLKIMLVGGEAMSSKLYQKLKKETFNAFNVYGPTETTIWSSYLKIKDSNQLSIGKPLNNETIVILNSQGQLQPIGVAGELCIGGEGVSLGYLNKETLTKEKFIDSPVTGGKLYKTGDMARWNENGCLEFFGRTDDQVKVRGYRIELGEIENTLLKHEEVLQAVVLVKTNSIDEKEIMAYIKINTELNVSDLRNYLMTLLPSYMIPSTFVQVDQIPLTSSGKADRKALLQIQGQEVQIGSDYVAPRDEREKKIIAVLAKYLERSEDQIGIYDNFFDLGANSLKMMKILNEINEALSVNLKIVNLFEYNNIYQLMEFLQKGNKDSEEDYDSLSDDLDEILDMI